MRARSLTPMVALTALALAAGGPAMTKTLPAPISDAELDNMRGGYESVGGIPFSFGALMTTTVNGQLALQTQVNWGASGTHVTQTLGPNAVQAPSTSTGTITGLGAQGLPPGSVVTLNNGATALIQNVANGVQNIVLNTANGQNIKQSTQLQLNLPNFAALQQVFQQNIALMHLMQSAQSSIAGAGH